MDQAFAPNSTPEDARLRRMLAARTNTTLQTPAGTTSIKDFFKFLNSSSLVADDLIVGAHARDEGFLYIALDSIHDTPPITYEDVADADSTGSIHIRPGIRKSTSKFHFKGCAIGSDNSLPFLKLLKSALDNPQQVTAPKFFHGLHDKYPPGSTSKGIFEFMGHDFRVNYKPQKTKLKIPDLVTMLQNASSGFQRLDGTTIDKADIATWVHKKLDTQPAKEDRKPIQFPVKIVPKTGGRDAIDDLPAVCVAKRETYPFDPGTGAMPKTLPDLKAAIQADPLQQDTHLYPIWKRLFYSSFDDFFDNQDWKLKSKQWLGTHFVYTLRIPVVKKTTTDELFFNFYPDSGTPTMNFLETDTDMFGQV